MSGIYDTTEAPAQPFAAVEGIRTTLVTGSDIVRDYFIEAAADVYQHWHGDDPPERFLVVREVHPVGSKYSNHAKIDDAAIQVMAAIRRTLDDGRINPNVHRWLAAMHKRIHDKLTGTSPALLVGTVLLPIRIEQYASVPEIDTDIHYWFSTAQYNITLAGV